MRAEQTSSRHLGTNALAPANATEPDPAVATISGTPVPPVLATRMANDATPVTFAQLMQHQHQNARDQIKEKALADVLVAWGKGQHWAET